LIPAHPARTRWGPSTTGVARHPWPLGLPVFFPLGICRWPRLPPTLQIGVINGCKHAQRCTGPTAAERWSLPQTPRRATQRGRPSVPPVPLSLFVSALYLASAPELNSNLRLSNFYLHSVCLVSFVSLHVRRTDGRKRSVGVPSAARTIRSLVVVLTFGPIRAYTYIYYASIYQIRIPIGCNIPLLPLPPPGPPWRPVLNGNRNPSETSANVVDSSYTQCVSARATHNSADQIKSVSIRFLGRRRPAPSLSSLG
jgi:hypothetical protein